MTPSASGFTKGGTLNEALYRKLSTLRVQMTPKIAASSIRCCSDRWFRGSSSKISTWFTPDERHPYTFTPMRNKNCMTSSGPRYSRNAIFRLSRDPSWNIASRKNIEINFKKGNKSNIIAPNSVIWCEKWYRDTWSHLWAFLTFRAIKNPFNPYSTAFPYGNGMVLHFYQQQESSTTKTVHKVINKGLKTYV